MAPCYSTLNNKFTCQDQGYSVQARGEEAAPTFGACISRDSVDNGVNDCEDKSDEFGK